MERVRHSRMPWDCGCLGFMCSWMVYSNKTSTTRKHVADLLDFLAAFFLEQEYLCLKMDLEERKVIVSV
jgi:hypothetical protein